MKLPRGLTLLLGWLFVIAIAVFVQHKLGWAALLAPWQRLHPLQLVLAVLLLLLTYLLRSLRQSAYFPREMAGRFWLSTRLMVWHNFYNNFLPMRSGELAFPLLAQRYFNIPMSQATGALLWFRVLDLWAIALMGLLAAALKQPLWLVALVLLLPLPALAVYLAQPIGRWLVAHPSSWANKGGKVLSALPNTTAALWSSSLWTLANWLVKLLAFAWLLTAFATMPYTAAILGAIGGDLTSVLPIHSPAGLGTYEAGVVAGLTPFGITAALAVPAALSLHIMILASTVIGALLMNLVPAHVVVEKEDGHE